MPSMELKDRLQNMAQKVDSLRRKYVALLNERKELTRKVESQSLEIAKLKK